MHLTSGNTTNNANNPYVLVEVNSERQHHVGDDLPPSYEEATAGDPASEGRVIIGTAGVVCFVPPSYGEAVREERIPLLEVTNRPQQTSLLEVTDHPQQNSTDLLSSCSSPRNRALVVVFISMVVVASVILGIIIGQKLCALDHNSEGNGWSRKP
ncbi:hypothetical protein [Candidatus Ichthyocystis hellenicum]|uniref:hypothetical protein n=1 Tax=Candidatus Ichthyocystis hellenicum TaxID=1561003 RepID=UPI000B8766A6|nr:hypothetical protein [Candidatus Ichthyocystis hellenicum]